MVTAPSSTCCAPSSSRHTPGNDGVCESCQQLDGAPLNRSCVVRPGGAFHCSLSAHTQSHSTAQLTACRWQALLLVMDNRPFPDLRHIVRDAEDERVQVFAEWVSGGPSHSRTTQQSLAGWQPQLSSSTLHCTLQALCTLSTCQHIQTCAQPCQAVSVLSHSWLCSRLVVAPVTATCPPSSPPDTHLSHNTLLSPPRYPLATNPARMMGSSGRLSITHDCTT